MTEVFVFKERLKQFYAKNALYVTPVIKFIYGWMAVLILNLNIGFMAKLKNPAAGLVLALVCAFLPYGAITLVVAAVMLAHLTAVSLELTLVMSVFLLVIGLLYYGFQPGDSYLLVLVPLFFCLRIPYAIPLLVGLSGSFISVIPIGCGVLIFYTLQYVKQNAVTLTNDASLDIAQKYVQIVKTVMSNKLMLIMIVAFAIALITVHLIKNMSIDYSWVIAIAAGTIAQLVVIFIGDFSMDVSVSMAELLFGILGSVCLAGIYHFFVFAIDYSRTEYVQFEDDDYYYYVKAVPKVTVSAPDIRVQKINSRKSHKRGTDPHQGYGSR